MAQKQFKIGLSNTDKQNMAQDVYERVLALTFNEYDTTTEYEVGDFVVYNDQLYKCISATSGAWDSSKWQLATLNDLVDDIENAVAFVNDKANVDGNYPTMTVGAADNLTPYDEDSGVDQEQPFLLQGTGCGNGEQQVDTGALGLLKEKQGNTVVVNQLARPLNASNWDFQDANGSFSDGVATFTANATNGQLFHQAQIKTLTNHKYIFVASIKTNASANEILLKYGWRTIAQNILTSGWQLLIDLLNQTEDASTYITIIDARTSNFDAIQVKNVGLIDLTQWFGSNDNIPAHLLSHPEDFFRYYQGSLAYNEGELVNANGRYLKAIGRNQWDEEWEVGSIDESGSAIEGNAIHSKNLIKVIPNTDYYFKVGTGGYLIIDWFDKDGNNVGYLFGYGRNDHYKAPANAVSMKFAVVSGYGTTYNHDITISLYYEDESGYDQYYPYEELTNNDTGTEVLRSAGSVRDSKAPDGTITRRVGVVSYDGSEDENWTLQSINTHGIANFSISLAYRDNQKAICNRFSLQLTGIADTTDEGFLLGGNHDILFIRIKSTTASTVEQFKTWLANNNVSLNYELAEPTAEQGTPYSENIAIDDFGSMDFGGTNGVPQGASIFYAVDYKAFIDSLFNTLDGDATDVVKDSELDSKLATLGYVKLTSVSGYDATKTQVLKNVEGTLTWVTEE